MANSSNLKSLSRKSFAGSVFMTKNSPENTIYFFILVLNF